MSEHSTIEWTDATWNPIVGCSVVSPGCTNCYAMRLAGTRMANHPTRRGLTTPSKAGPVWNGEVRLLEQKLTEPLRWKRPRMIFVCAHGDLFHESVPDEWIDRIFAVMALAPQHTFQILTKRSARMRDYLSGEYPLHRLHQAAAGDFSGALARQFRPWGNVYSLYLGAPWPLPNVWLGVSVEDQERAGNPGGGSLDQRRAPAWPARSSQNLVGTRLPRLRRAGAVHTFAHVGKSHRLGGRRWRERPLRSTDEPRLGSVFTRSMCRYRDAVFLQAMGRMGAHRARRACAGS